MCVHPTAMRGMEAMEGAIEGRDEGGRGRERERAGRVKEGEKGGEGGKREREERGEGSVAAQPRHLSASAEALTNNHGRGRSGLR